MYPRRQVNCDRYFGKELTNVDLSMKRGCVNLKKTSVIETKKLNKNEFKKFIAANKMTRIDTSTSTNHKRSKKKKPTSTMLRKKVSDLCREGYKSTLFERINRQSFLEKKSCSPRAKESLTDMLEKIRQRNRVPRNIRPGSQNTFRREDSHAPSKSVNFKKKRSTTLTKSVDKKVRIAKILSLSRSENDPVGLFQYSNTQRSPIRKTEPDEYLRFGIDFKNYMGLPIKNIWNYLICSEVWFQLTPEYKYCY